VEETVLVGVGGFHQDGEGATDRSVPSKVRLHVLDACPMRTLDAAQDLVDSVTRRGAFRVDGELVSTVRLGSVEDDELPDEVVESRPQVVDDFAEDDRPLGICALPDIDALDAPVALALKLWRNEVRLSVDVGPDRGIESVKQLVCPLEPKARVF
jgi:hypothetical protein